MIVIRGGQTPRSVKSQGESTVTWVPFSMTLLAAAEDPGALKRWSRHIGFQAGLPRSFNPCTCRNTLSDLKDRAHRAWTTCRTRHALVFPSGAPRQRRSVITNALRLHMPRRQKPGRSSCGAT